MRVHKAVLTKQRSKALKPRFLPQASKIEPVKIKLKPVLSVLKSHFNPASITVLKQLLSKSEKRFVHTHWVQEGLGLSEVL